MNTNNDFKELNFLSSSSETKFAHELMTETWLNTGEPLSLSKLRGKVVAIHAFQMLCPGCVTHGLPQATAISDLYKGKSVQVIGLHSVFEHHSAMNVDALKAFVHEYRIRFPIAVDLASENNPVPMTMREYKLQGTPSLILIDKIGRIRLKHFGRMSDMKVGGLIGQLLQEVGASEQTLFGDSLANEKSKQGGCDADACSI